MTLAPSRQQLPDRLVRARWVHRQAIKQQLVDRRLDAPRRHVRIQRRELRPQPVAQNDLRLVVAAEATRATRDRRRTAPYSRWLSRSRAVEQRERRLLDEAALREAASGSCGLCAQEVAEIDVGDVEPSGDEAR